MEEIKGLRKRGQISGKMLWEAGRRFKEKEGEGRLCVESRYNK